MWIRSLGAILLLVNAAICCRKIVCKEHGDHRGYITKDDLKLADRGHDVIKIVEKYGGCGQGDISHMKLLSRLRFHIYRAGYKSRKFRRRYSHRRGHTEIEQSAIQNDIDTEKKSITENKAVEQGNKNEVEKPVVQKEGMKVVEKQDIKNDSEGKQKHEESQPQSVALPPLKQTFSSVIHRSIMPMTPNAIVIQHRLMPPIRVWTSECRQTSHRSRWDNKGFLAYMRKRFYLFANAQRYVQKMTEMFESMIKGEKAWKSSVYKRKMQNQHIIEQVDQMISAHHTKAARTHRMSIRSKIVKFIRDVDMVISGLKRRNSNLEKTMATWIALNKREKQQIFQIIQRAQRKDMLRVVQLKDLRAWYLKKLHLLSAEEQRKMRSYIDGLQQIENKRLESMEASLQKYMAMSSNRQQADEGYQQSLSRVQAQNRYLWAINNQQSKQLEHLSRLLLDRIIPAHKEELNLMRQNMRQTNILAAKCTARVRCPKCPPPLPPILVPKPVFVHNSTAEMKKSNETTSHEREKDMRKLSASREGKRKSQRKRIQSYDKYLSEELAKSKKVTRRLEKESKEALKHISKCVHQCPTIPTH